MTRSRLTLAERTPLFVTIVREPIRRVLSEFDWGQKYWCTPNLLHDPWNPWPPSLCAALLNGSRHDAFTVWVAARNNPAHNRQAHFFGAPLRAPRLEGKASCLWSHTRLADAWPELRAASPAAWDLQRTIGTSRCVLERAWAVLRGQYWVVGTLGDGRGIDDFVAVLRGCAPSRAFESLREPSTRAFERAATSKMAPRMPPDDRVLMMAPRLPSVIWI